MSADRSAPLAVRRSVLRRADSEQRSLLTARSPLLTVRTSQADLIARVQEVWDMPLLSAEPAPAAPGISAESAAEMRKAKDPADLEKILRDLNMQVRYVRDV
jgi:hypothetical protein